MSYLRVLMSFALVVSAEAYANDFPEVSIRQVRALNDDGDGSALEAELVRVTGVTTTGGRQYAPTSNCDNPPCTPGVGFYLDDESIMGMGREWSVYCRKAGCRWSLDGV